MKKNKEKQKQKQIKKNFRKIEILTQSVYQCLTCNLLYHSQWVLVLEYVLILLLYDQSHSVSQSALNCSTLKCLVLLVLCFGFFQVS